MLNAVESGASVAKCEAQQQIAALLDADRDVVFTATVRYGEAIDQAPRERGLLMHELDEQVYKGPERYEIRRGGAKAKSQATRNVSSVADNLQAVAQEIVSRMCATKALEVTA